MTASAARSAGASMAVAAVAVVAVLATVAVAVVGVLALVLVAPASAVSMAPAREMGAPTISGWLWPVALPAEVSAEFVAPATRYGAGHRGLDVRASPGTAVLAPQSGVVAFVGVVGERTLIAIDHPGGFRSSLEPVQASVVAGDPVVAGQPIGTVSTGGHCAARCLHLGVRLDGVYLNPRAVLSTIPRAVLLPP